MLVSLAFIDPGIMKKNLERFEYADVTRIPASQKINSARLKNEDITYNFPIKSHFLRVKSCKTCLIFRAPRMVHCFTCNVCI